MFNPNDEQLEKLMSLVMDTKDKLENEELELYSHLFLQFLAAEIGLSADIKIIPEDDEKHRKTLEDYERIKSRLIKEKTSNEKQADGSYVALISLKGTVENPTNGEKNDLNMNISIQYVIIEDQIKVQKFTMLK